jgi:predicted AlkP superfamily pyrophosphatase or phosphodiesterase
MNRCFWSVFLLPWFAGYAHPASVLMVSVDGMKPEYVLQADRHQLKIPFLRSMLRDGTHASGVQGVFPSVTYPSHTTLLTGVSPAGHGIYNNLQFDPKHKFNDAWNWYAKQIRVPTLWQAAHEAGLATASVGWPVSVGAPVDTLIPEYWRIFQPTADLDPEDTRLIAELSRPLGLLDDMQRRLGPYMAGNDPGAAGDEIKTRFALDILERAKPQFMTIHLSSLDETEHAHGPFSPAADQALEAIDAELARLFAAVRRNDPDSIAVVVSDHGFTTITHRINFQPALDSLAQVWPAGGMAAVMLHDPGDAAALAQTRAALQALADDPRNGIGAVLDADQIRKTGGFPDAAFVVLMQPGFYVAGDPRAQARSDIAGPAGGHGYAPENLDMRAAFFVAGRGIARQRDLGLIDMRRIAPTIAALLGVRLPSADAAPLTIRP